MNEAGRERARRAIGTVARRMLAGHVSYLDGARALLRFRAEGDLGADPAFEAFALIESETDHLPIGQQRKHWSQAALVAKEPDIRAAEEWAARTAEMETKTLATRFQTQAPTTTEILARRMLERECGQECVDWAIGMLERGYDSTALRVLAGLTPPFSHYEVCSLRDRALGETRAAELAIEDPINAWVAEIAYESTHDTGGLRVIFGRVAHLAMELGHPADLEPFFLLHFAAEDLIGSEMQWYWPGATKDNIDEIMVQEAQRFIAQHAG